jgi:RNA dependent RNA polymerase
MQTYFTIIKALGNFSHIYSPARCAARIGQAFSETPFAVPLEENRIRVETIDDVRSPDRSRVISDGVGTVSWDVMEIIQSNLPPQKGSPTCFQIRLGGAKGMLAVDSRLSGSLIQIRPSMTKFDSDDMRDLGICDMASTPIPLVLNRQVIKILEDMGVSDDWFFKLQTAELTRLRGITASDLNTAHFLKAQNIGNSIRLHKLYRQCALQGIDFRREAFLRSIVEAVVLRELRLLKHKARIPVDEGITLFGIMDETGFLQENQVYVTFDTMQGRYPPPPGPGPLLVTRSPALYDGDIQVAHNAIPPPDHPLIEHRNCIVFSQKGNRDLPSQLSGGDLDGDLYNVIWDAGASPIRTFEPADYPRVDPVNIGRPVLVDDMANFFIDFMRTDYLGVVATRHMILADQMEAGTHHPDCKKLAELHSTAVDFSKTGIPVRMQELPRANNYRPDL